MPRVTPVDASALNVLDWLYFNQILVHCAFSDHEITWLKKIAALVQSAVEKSEASNDQSEIIKHFVYCLLEIHGADFIDVPSLKEGRAAEISQEMKDTFSQAFEKVNRGDHLEELKVAYEIALTLLDIYRSAPPSVRHRFAERVLALDFPHAPLDFLLWLETNDTFHIKKYDDKLREASVPRAASVRIGLLIEFESMRGAVGRHYDSANPIHDALNFVEFDAPTWSKARLNEEMNHFNDIFLGNSPHSSVLFCPGRRWESTYMEAFFRAFEDRWSRPRLCTTPKHGWINFLGALYVAVRKRDPGSGHVFSSKNNDASKISNLVSSLLETYGYPASARVVNDRYQNEFQQHLHFVRVYYKALSKMNIAPDALWTDSLYYIAFVKTDPSGSSFAESVP